MMHLTTLETQVAGLMVLVTALGLLWRQVIRPAFRGAVRISRRLDQVLECTEQLPELVEQQREQTQSVSRLVEQHGALRETVASTARLSAVEDGKLAGRIDRLEDDQRRIWSTVHHLTEGVPTP